jgi:hypothetical protein
MNSGLIHVLLFQQMDHKMTQRNLGGFLPEKADGLG